MDSICADHESSDDRSTPRYLNVLICSRRVPFSINCGGWTVFFFREIIMALHLFGLSVRLLDLTQSLMQSMSDCRCLKSSGDLTCL